jgi:outer membrane protein OmpA-like peptidoglycan-associated protein
MYPISSAKTPRQHEQINALASVSACGRVIPFDELYGRPESVGGVLYVVEDVVIMKEGALTTVAGVKMDDILFDFDAYAVRPEFNEDLNDLGRFLQKTPEAYVVLAGHTDSIGTEEYNLGLSRRRAESVASHLMQNFGIGRDRITTLWYGKADPVASNATPEGRALNRRVVPVVGGLQ